MSDDVRRRSFATSSGWRLKDGEKEEETEMKVMNGRSEKVR